MRSPSVVTGTQPTDSPCAQLGGQVVTGEFMLPRTKKMSIIIIIVSRFMTATCHVIPDLCAWNCSTYPSKGGTDSVVTTYLAT